jgi:hypothetical protein
VRRQRIALASGLALAYSLALLGDQMLYVVLPSHPAAAGIATASLGIILSANGLCAGFMLSALLALAVVRQASVGRVSVAR